MDTCEQKSYHPVTWKSRGGVKGLHMLEGETARKISLKSQIFTLQNVLPLAELDRVTLPILFQCSV